MATDGKSPISAEVLLQILKQNGAIFPASCFHMTFTNGGEGIRIVMILPNQGVSPSVIRRKM